MNIERTNNQLTDKPAITYSECYQQCFCSDNLELMKTIESNTIDLIYCDILYGTGRKFADYQDLKPIRCEIENHYIPRIKEMRRILKDTGSIYLQMSEEILHWMRCIMDDIFGYEMFLRQIYWKRTDNKGSSKSRCRTFPNSIDCIICYSKTDNFTFNVQYSEYSQQRIDEFRYEDENGKYRWQTLKTYSQNRYNELMENGMIKIPQTSKNPQFKQYLKESKGVILDNNWQDVYYVKYNSKYFSEKPKALIERIIKASSNEGDLVADFYLGSGTTAEVCKDLNRNFIGCDINPRAIEITLQRLNDARS